MTQKNNNRAKKNLLDMAKISKNMAFFFLGEQMTKIKTLLCIFFLSFFWGTMAYSSTPPSVIAWEHDNHSHLLSRTSESGTAKTRPGLLWPTYPGHRPRTRPLQISTLLPSSSVQWRNLRKVSAMQIFAPQKLNSTQTIMRKKVQQLIDHG